MNARKQWQVVLLGGLSSLALTTMAATPLDSGVDLNRTRDAFSRDQLREELREENKRIDEEERAKKEERFTETRPPVQQASLFLNKVEFTPSTVLSESDLQALTGKYEQRKVTIGDLYQLVEEINQLYKARGYVTATALLTQQEIKNGVVKILLVEGKVGQVKLEKNESTNDDYIHERIDLPKGQVPNLNELDKQLQWFNGTNDVKLAIQLGAGEEPGTTDFHIVAQEPDRHQFTLMSDSAGRKDIGNIRTGVGYTNASLTGRRDALSVIGMFSRSSQTALLQYNIPLNRLGTRLAAYYNANRMKITDGDLNHFNVKGKAEYFGVTLTHPIFSETRFKQDISLDIQKQNSSTTILGADFVIDREYRFSLGTGLTYYGVGEVYYFKPVFMQGRYKGLLETKDVSKLKADFIWQKQDGHENLYSVTIAGQKAFTHYLPSSDQFYLGGMYSIRGYKESMINADSGISANLEARIPVKSLRSSVLFFLDAGKLYGENTLSTRTLVSAGLGLSSTFLKNSDITMTVGFPMKKRVLDEKVDSWRAHFGLNIRL